MKSGDISQHPLKTGATYRALREIGSLLEPISEGDIIRFDREEYSPYDNMTIFIFYRDNKNGEMIRWTVFDIDPEPRWDELFEKI
ncbi:MAG: hypothetical protein EOP49_54055 [Sphingobacteriales bacterium]|nr:MAG: hypothetical protein EOP49_54055 [Sphingobacteriales bacterium]